MIITALKLLESNTPNSYGSKYQIIEVIDSYFSVLWVDRYNEYGEFELVLPANDKYIINLKEDYILVSNESETIMVIEHVGKREIFVLEFTVSKHTNNSGVSYSSFKLIFRIKKNVTWKPWMMLFLTNAFYPFALDNLGRKTTNTQSTLN